MVFFCVKEKAACASVWETWTSPLLFLSLSFSLSYIVLHFWHIISTANLSLSFIGKRKKTEKRREGTGRERVCGWCDQMDRGLMRCWICPRYVRQPLAETFKKSSFAFILFYFFNTKIQVKIRWLCYLIICIVVSCSFFSVKFLTSS